MTRPPNHEPVLRVRDLTVTYHGTDSPITAVRGVDLDIMPGEVVALVGESGSGKSSTAHAVVGLLPPGSRMTGSIRVDGVEMSTLSQARLRDIRGRVIGFIPQDPSQSLDPTKRVGDQVAEVLRIHDATSRRAARSRAVDLLEAAGLPDPAVRAKQYPHELSGGMRQRVLIAAALACRPALVIADEPTSALDVTVQAQVLDSLDQLTRDMGTAVLLVTHDLGVAADRARRVVVMSTGRIVEHGTPQTVLRSPAHSYTQRLIASIPTLNTAMARGRPEPREATPLLVAHRLVKEYRHPGRSGRRRSRFRAVDDVSFTIGKGETFAIVGESGSGKSTTARLITRLTSATAGDLTLGGLDLARAKGKALRQMRKRIQLVHQNPDASLDPRMTVEAIVEEPMWAFGVGTAPFRRARAADLVDQVSLPRSVLQRRARELSGGQRQRVAIARALALQPELLVCDEPVSALDVTVQAQILDLLTGLQADLGLSYLFISHDLAVVGQISDRVAVMRNGRILELGTTEEIFSAPQSAYTRQLLDAIPGRGVFSA